MYKKTFEVLAKWIASEYNVKIVFDEQDGAGHAELNTNTIHLPHNIANSNALSALALLMHEAAHLAHSKILPMKDLVKDQEDHMILNAIEDIRIDYLNFNKLPNIRTFYEQLVKDHIDLTKSQAPKEITALCGAILNAEGFSPKATPEVSKIMNDATLINALYEGRWNIGNKA